MRTIRDDKLVYEILKNGGITFDTKTNQKFGRHYGYIVSIEGCEQKVSIEDLTLKVITEYIDEHLNILNQSEYYFGAWIDGGTVYLDISKFSERKQDAEWLGVFENQIAIYDIENESEIILDYEKIKNRKEDKHTDIFKDKITKSKEEKKDKKGKK